jgi:ABC-type Mn2+/Zn2+ transport system permease subunit
MQTHVGRRAFASVVGLVFALALVVSPALAASQWGSYVSQYVNTSSPGNALGGGTTGPGQR